MFNLLDLFKPHSDYVLSENAKRLVITYVLIDVEIYFNFRYYTMGFCGIGYYVTLGIMVLGIMSHWVLWHGVRTFRPMPFRPFTLSTDCFFDRVPFQPPQLSSNQLYTVTNFQSFLNVTIKINFDHKSVVVTG